MNSIKNATLTTCFYYCLPCQKFNENLSNLLGPCIQYTLYSREPWGNNPQYSRETPLSSQHNLKMAKLVPGHRYHTQLQAAAARGITPMQRAKQVILKVFDVLREVIQLDIN